MDRIQELFNLTHPAPRLAGSYRTGPLIAAMNALFISMLGDKHIPEECKPPYSGQANIANLTQTQLTYFLDKTSSLDHLVDWLRDNYPEMVAKTILNSERLAEPHQLPTKMAVYIEHVGSTVLIKPLGVCLPKEGYRTAGVPLAGGKALELLERTIVFYGPSALAVSTMLTDEMVDAINQAYAIPENFVDARMSPMSVWREDCISMYEPKVPEEDKTTRQLVELLTPMTKLALANLLLADGYGAKVWLIDKLRKEPIIMENVAAQLHVGMFLNDAGELCVVYK